MVIRSRNHTPTLQSGFLMAELVVAMAIIVLALFPLASLYVSEQRLARSCYERAVAMEIVDGEMEVLLAGEWKAFNPGTTNYPLSQSLRSNLPPGTLLLTVGDSRVRLQWTPTDRGYGGQIVRVGRIK